ncbi:MAG: dephospho-CoA kinase [Candidatus Eisenbacteria bacterium]|uniref:Dephospho-CoA kinase n=1 Tax=Eiseniibacteriota bacterium TaxID=2212470 RepID=A0A538SX09_UNCEI|nr:MAG: dephospho-CoA kinase [Candidatus Eisenbacteria bacterium]
MSIERRPAAGDGLFILGLIGRAGSGKTTVARALEHDGARVIEADRVGHEVADRDPAVREGLIAEYGAGVYRADGTLDRGRVAARVFRDPEARARLDRLVHPRIVARIREEIGQLRREGFRGVVVVDAALMPRWGFERECDAVIAVVAPESEQVARLVRGRGWSEAEARARLAAQDSNEASSAAADVTLDNDGTPEALARAAREAVSRLRAGRGAPC